MSNSPSRRKSNMALAGEVKARKGLIKIDMTQLEDAIQDLYSQNLFLKDKIEHLEIALNRDEALEHLKKNMEEFSARGRETNVTVSNIQAKIIEIESTFLKIDQRSKTFDMELKVARNNEKDTKTALKREVKILNTKMFDAEKRLPEIAQQFTRPLEEKLLLAYSALDDIEREFDHVEERVNDIEIANGGSKRRIELSESENEDSDEVPNIVTEEVKGLQNSASPEVPTGNAIQDAQILNTQAANGVVLPSQSSFKSVSNKSKKKRENRRKARELLAKSLAEGGSK